MFVGDLSEGDLRLIKIINQLTLPTAVVLGNHDRGHDTTGELLQQQLSLLGERHCGWQFRNWDLPRVGVVGARPCSPGGGFYLTPPVEALFGPITVDQSASRIVSAAKRAPSDWPLIILAHSGPTGLGSERNSPCGRDWKSPAVDWGDYDLALAIDQIRSFRRPDLVVFGHMHHQLKGSESIRQTFYTDKWGTSYINTASVPRHLIDEYGRKLFHFSWIEIDKRGLISASHRWFLLDGSLAYEQVLLKCNYINR